MLSNTVKKELQRIVGARNASFSKEDALCYSYDATGEPSLPEGVVFPSSAEEVSLILKMANAEGFPVVPRGAGSGFTGGSVPVNGGVVLSTEQMRGVQVDTDNLVAEVGPGVITGEFQEEVEALGLFYPPDPTSLKFSTIGGNIAECAGGPRALKYGTTRDYVLGLEVVLPTGDIIRTGAKTMKGVVGYDLTRLMVGSEGTLGVVTKAFLRLLPLPEAIKTMYVTYSTLQEAASTVSAIIRSKVVPSTLEFIDGACIRCVEEFTKMGLPQVEAVLLIEVDGHLEAVDKEAGLIKELCLENRATDFRVVSGKNEVRDLWKVRRNISPSLYRLKPTKINEDVVVPRSHLVELITGVQVIARSRGVLIASFGHAGDGNIHINIMVDKDDPEEAALAEAVVRDVFELTLSLGGTISGEHGVGTKKAPYLGMELSKASIDAMRGIKDTLDPNGILNPGKIFSSQHQLQKAEKDDRLPS